MASFGSRLKHAWNVFTNQDEGKPSRGSFDDGPSTAFRPDRVRLVYGNEKSIISSILTRLAIDISSVDIRHVRLDDDGRYLEDVKSGLNSCLTLEANLDQAATHFKRDMALSLFDEGSIAIVPVETTLNPANSASFDIKTMRVGRITQWWPKHVTVNLYNEATGRRQDVKLEKSTVAIVENPLYTIMNEPNSTLQRLIRRLNLLDAIDEQSASGKLDILIQLPYVVRSETRREQAKQRAKEIEFQLQGNRYGIAYIDGTEKVTQLNRPADNNMLKTIEWLTAMLYSQLGITDTIMNGTADEATMLNYMNRTVQPVLTAIVEAMRRVFLSKTARTQGQSVMFFRDPFKLVPISQIAEIADKFTRNEILSANEIRQAIGFKPSSDPNADKLRNSNMPAPSEPGDSPSIEEGDSQNGA